MDKPTPIKKNSPLATDWKAIDSIDTVKDIIEDSGIDKMVCILIDDNGDWHCIRSAMSDIEAIGFLDAVKTSKVNTYNGE